jgi:hypothetical protein
MVCSVQPHLPCVPTCSFSSLGSETCAALVVTNKVLYPWEKRNSQHHLTPIIISVLWDEEHRVSFASKIRKHDIRSVSQSKETLRQA